MMESIAQTAMDMSAAQFSMAYATSVTKMSMDTQELALQAITDMIPSTPPAPMGKYIDTYA